MRLVGYLKINHKRLSYVAAPTYFDLVGSTEVFHLMLQQDMPCTYNLTLRRTREATVTVEKQ